MSSLNSSPQQPRFFEAPLSCFSEASTRLLPRETKWHTLKRVSQDHLEWPDFLPLAGFFRTILHGLIVASCRPHLSSVRPAPLLPRETKWHTLKRVSQDHLEWPDFLPLAGFFRTILHGLIVASCRPHLGAPTPARTVAKVVKGVGWGAAQTASKSARTYLRSSTK